MKTLVVRTCQAAMNRRTGRLAAVVVVLVALSSSAAWVGQHKDRRQRCYIRTDQHSIKTDQLLDDAG